MAIGPNGFIPDYAQQAAQQGQTTPYWTGNRIGNLVMGGLMGGGQGGLGAYAMQQGMRQAVPQPQQPGASAQSMKNAVPGTQQVQPTAGGMPQQQSFNASQALNEVLQHLTTQKMQQLMGQGYNIPQPKSLQEQAFKASQQQSGLSQPPQWNANAPSFAFDQYFNDQMPANALGILGDAITGDEEEGETPWWRTGIRGVGALASLAAPIAGRIPGPWGTGLGIGLGALGGLSQHV